MTLINNRKILLLIIPLIFSLTFFLVGFFTISNYGINWDEPIHFIRGQAYLNFFLPDGQKTYNYSENQRNSIYNDKIHDATFYMNNDCCHPVLNGILYSLSNRIFFEKLGWLPDIGAYNLMGIVLSSFLVFLLTWFVAYQFNLVAAIVAGISLFIYPMFLAETHINVKDPPETVFYTTCLILIYFAVKKLSWKLLILAGIVFGLAWGTKFNILFLPVVIIPWLFYVFFTHKKDVIFRKASTKAFFILIIPILLTLGFVIFFASWPYLWQSPENMLSIFAWYRHIGSGFNYEPEFLVYGFNTYPAIWIIFTTPLSILILSLAGIVTAIKMIFKKSEKTSLLIIILLWFSIPIIRVSLPNTSIYGGVRQIMEYVPAMAILTGIGFLGLLRIFSNKIIKGLVIVLVGGLFAFNIWEIIEIHPNETVYFNQLAGGLRGAYEKELSEAGGDLGNVYRQGANWINENAEEGARLTLVNNGTSALPSTFLRPDIKFSEEFWSGEEKKGEYIMNTTQVGWESVIPDKGRYVNENLRAIYQVKVDGVAILKIWKNSFK